METVEDYEPLVAGLPRLTLQAGGKVFVVNGSPTGLDAEAAFCGRDLAAFAEAIGQAFPEADRL